MLYTRCPDCQTSFRITVSALTKADGKVRCGQCDAVFSASDELEALKLPPDPPSPDPVGRIVTEWSMSRPSPTDSFMVLENRDTETIADEPTAGDSTADEATADEATADEELADEELADWALSDDTAADEALADWATADEATRSEPAAEDEEAIVASVDTVDTTVGVAEQSSDKPDEWATFFARARASASEFSVAESGPLAKDFERDEELESAEDIGEVEELGNRTEPTADEESIVDQSAEPTTATSDLTAEQIDVTLSSDLDLESRLAAIEPEPLQPSRRSGLWIAGAALMIVGFAIQATHYFRSELANQAIIGPLLQSVYLAIGRPIAREWDLTQYEILDWVATASAGGAGEDTLNISARIRNNGPAAQPYPSIRLALKDRWEQTVGSRIFSPREYLPEDHLSTGLMPAGLMAQATFEVADRSDDAYGFELDVCVQANTGSVACVTDDVFD